MINEYYELVNFNDDKIINLLKDKKINLNINKLLCYAIIWNKNKLINYLLDYENIDLNYIDGYEDYLLTATRSGNLYAIDQLIKKGVDFKKNYNIFNMKNVLYFIKDLDIFKYFEKLYDKKDIEEALNCIIIDTIGTYDFKLLKYIMNNYKVGKLSEVKFYDEVFVSIFNMDKSRITKSYNEYKTDKEYLDFYNYKVKPYYEYVEKYLEVEK